MYHKGSPSPTRGLKEPNGKRLLLNLKKRGGGIHDEVYEGMKKAGVASTLENPIWVDKDQKETNKEIAVGRVATPYVYRACSVYLYVDDRYNANWSTYCYCYCYCYLGLRVRWSDHNYCGY